MEKDQRARDRAQRAGVRHRDNGVRFCPDRYGTDPERLMYAHGYTTGHAPVCLCVVMNARTNVNAPSMSAHELHNAVTAAAETDGVSFGAWVRRACEERLARQRAQRPSVGTGREDGSGRVRPILRVHRSPNVTVA